MNNSQSSPKMTPDEKERTALKIRLLQRGLNYRDLAKMTGRSQGSIANLLCGNDCYWPARSAVNAVLGELIFSKRNMPRRPVRKKTCRPRRHRSTKQPPTASPALPSRFPTHAID